MKRGSVVYNWTEPVELRRVLLCLARENNARSWTRFFPLIFVGIIISGILIFQWWGSDREGIISTICSVVAGSLVLGGFYLFQRIKITFFPTRFWICENGIEMGEPLGERQWTAYSEIDGFSFDTDTIEGITFRSLNWLPTGASIPECAPLSSDVDEEQIRTFLKSKGLMEIDTDEE